MNVSSALNLYNPGRGLSGPAWLTLIPAIDMAERHFHKESGLGDFDLENIIGSGIDTVGKIFGKQPINIVSNQGIPLSQVTQPPQNVYMYPPPPGSAPVQATPKPSGVGFQVDQKTLLLAAGAILIFMVASKR